MKKVLVCYLTHSGTTRDVVEVIAEEITKTGIETEVLELSQVKSTADYAAVVLGAPMLVGWHRDAQKFLQKHKAELAQKPLALFLTGMSLTESPIPEHSGIDIHIDPKFASAPKNAKRLSFNENFASIKNYLRPILKAAPKSLAAIGLFGGRLDYYRLKWWEVIFVMLIVGAKPGEKRNWPDIRAWAASLPCMLKLENK